MSSLMLGGTVSMSSSSAHPNGWIIGYDVDGVLKQKDKNGVISLVGGSEIFTIELIDVLTTDFYAPFNLQVNSVSNVLNSPTTIIQVNNSTYTLGNSISIGDKITIIVDTISVVNLNIERI